MNQLWSESERKFVRENAGKLKDIELAKQLSLMTGRSVSLQSVRKQRQKMGIAKNPGRGKCEVLVQEKKEPTTEASPAQEVSNNEQDKQS